MIDFGLAKRVPSGPTTMEMQSVVGTLQYLPPEILQKQLPYTEKCDSWSIGVVGYTIMSGNNPFQQKELNKMFDAIRFEEVQFPSPGWSVISSDVKYLLSSLLCKEPIKRASVSQAFTFLSKNSSYY